MKFGLRRTLLTILLTVQFAMVAHAYGPLGHEIVGAIADEQLANTPTATKIRALLDGFTLEKAAVIADEIKGWDKNGVDNPRSFHYSAHRNIDSQCGGEAEAIGESIGFFRVAASDIPLLIEETKARLSGAGRRESYDNILRALVRAGRFFAEDITGIPWTEIDFPEDVAYANNIILTALQDRAVRL
jgi:hypothetical protein